MWKSATTTNNFRPRIAARAFVALAFVFAVSPVQAQIFSDDVARELAAANAVKLEDLLRLVENMRTRLGTMTQEQQGIDQRLRELAGQIEEVAAATTVATKASAAAAQARREVKALQISILGAVAEREKIAEDVATLRDQFADINEFIVLPPEREFYESAFADYQRKEYAQAVAGFQNLLKYYPDGTFNTNARYWMSQSFLAQGNNEAAVEMAKQLMLLPGNDGKIPDAMLVLAQAQKNLQQEEESRTTLEALIEAHPTTLAADQARQLLLSP